jgi:hypothetical protein
MNVIGPGKKSNIFKLFASIIIFLMPAILLAQDVSIWDFRIPETKYQRLTGSLSGRWRRTDNNSADYSFGALQNRSSGLSKYSEFQLDLNYDFAKYNENNSLEIGLQMIGQLNNQNNDYSYSYAAPYYNSTQSRTYFNVDISPDIRYSNYLVPDTWFWFAEGSGDYSFYQNTESYNTDYSDGSYYYDSSFTKNNSWSASVGSGIGYGKLRDGSAVFAVLRILDKLSEDSVFIRPLTKDEILLIVEVFAKEVGYSYSQDRYTKYFMEDIFVRLQKMGVLKENAVTAYSVLRAAEVLSERIEPRLFGWRARIGIQRRYTEENKARSQSDISRYTSAYFWYFHDYISLSLDYGYPLTTNLQVNSSFSIEVPRIDYQRKIDYKYQISGIYQIGERIDAIVSGSVSRSTNIYQSSDESEFLRTVQYSAGISFRFFIENNINFNVSYAYSKQNQDLFSLSNTGNNAYQFPIIEFGISYRIL